MTRARVLVVDTSALVRQCITELLARTDDLEVVGTAREPERANQLLTKLQPDVIMLDLELGSEQVGFWLKHWAGELGLPVVAIGARAHAGSEHVLRALSQGAASFQEKPSEDVQAGLEAVSAALIEKLRGSVRVRLRRRIGADLARAGSLRSSEAPRSADSPRERMIPSKPGSSLVPQGLSPEIRQSSRIAAPQGTVLRASLVSGRPSLATPASTPARTSIARPSIARPSLQRNNAVGFIAIGASTGGTEAILQVLKDLSPDTPPIVVVQHMPAQFTSSFAGRLDAACRMRVREAEHGAVLRTGEVLLAPGGYQMRVERSGVDYQVAITDEPPVGLHRPSVDVLFESCARVAGASAVGVILTGMGADGAFGMAEMHKAGALTLAQDEASCVVFGMPKEAIARGGVTQVLPLERIASYLGRVLVRIDAG
jgi:two-component system chemotaxis response regulator CheB